MNSKISLLSLLLLMGSMSVNAQSNTALKTEANNSMRKPVVSVEKVRVLYVGLENELAIMADCNSGDRINVTIDNGKISKTGTGIYMANPEKPGTATVLVEVNGQKHEYPFRVKLVPDPVAKVGNSSGGRIAANFFKAQKTLYADLENFVFEGVDFEVVGYTFYATDSAAFKEYPGVKVVSNAGGSFEPVKDLIARCQPGTTIVLDEIKVKGPDDQYRKLPAIAFNLY
jgi:hypothetical protein